MLSIVCMIYAIQLIWQGKQLYFIIQGADPTPQSIESTEYIMTRFAKA